MINPLSIITKGRLSKSTKKTLTLSSLGRLVFASIIVPTDNFDVKIDGITRKNKRTKLTLKQESILITVLAEFNGESVKTTKEKKKGIKLSIDDIDIIINKVKVQMELLN